MEQAKKAGAMIADSAHDTVYGGYLKKIKMPNKPAMLYPTILVGADVNGKPNYVTIGACGVVNLEPMLYISLKDTHYTTIGVKENGYFSVNLPSADMVQRQISAV